jgi:large subunit ribosomal protein L31
MKKKIHPKYMDTTVTCGCGETFTTRSTKPAITVEICSKCHPFYTGKQKFVDSAGQVEKFQKKFGWTDEKAVDVSERKGPKKAPKPPPPPKPSPASSQATKDEGGGSPKDAEKKKTGSAKPPADPPKAEAPPKEEPKS